MLVLVLCDVQSFTELLSASWEIFLLVLWTSELSHKIASGKGTLASRFDLLAAVLFDFCEPNACFHFCLNFYR